MRRRDRVRAYRRAVRWLDRDRYSCHAINSACDPMWRENQHYADDLQIAYAEIFHPFFCGTTAGFASQFGQASSDPAKQHAHRAMCLSLMAEIVETGGLG